MKNNETEGAAGAAADAVLEFDCPFCGARTSVFPTSILHGKPMCAEFEDNEVDIYMARVNDEFARRRGLRIERSGETP